MNIFFQYLLYSVSAIAQPLAPDAKLAANKSNKISVELRMSPKELKDSGRITFTAVEYIFKPATSSAMKKTQHGAVQIEMTSEEPVYLNFNNLLLIKNTGYYLAEPGDEVVITSHEGRFHFSGKGAEKYRLQYQLDSISRSIPKVNNKVDYAAFRMDSFGEYFAWTRFYQQRVDLGLPVLNSYKGKMSDWAFSYIKDNYIRYSAKNLRNKFYSLIQFGLSGKKISTENLVRVYDTSYSKHMQGWIDVAVKKQLMALELTTIQELRKYAFDSDSMPGLEEIQVILLKDILKNHHGRELENLVVQRLGSAMMRLGITPAIEKLLMDYYATPGYPEWKQWMKNKELAVRVNRLTVKAPDFRVKGAHGKLITNKELKGKIVALYFQDPAGTTNKTGDAVFRQAMEKYKDHPGVAFLKMPVEGSMAKDFVITSYPWIWVMDREGKIINAKPRIDLAQGNGDTLAAFIQQKIDEENEMHRKALIYKKDGPYVFHDGDRATAYVIDDVSLSKAAVDAHAAKPLQVQSDLDKTFSVQLQSAMTVQPAVFPAAEKLLVFSDIEGNFEAFRKLLQASQVIDGELNWIFGNGRLVFAGDMFDRGMQVTECLWLMYALEEKAKAAGGYVHFILGNHEIMNMQGNHTYAKEKYKTNAQLMGRSLTELYNENTELGRWLRTKNIMEKIGDLLFVHGGISPEMNRLPLGIEEINALARPWYGRTIDSANKPLLTMYDSRAGEKNRISPFWSRAYYKSNAGSGIITNKQLDSTFHKFNVRRVVTGHTIIADTISVHYGGRVINTDTEHAAGKSEALLIEGDRYYRVNSKGDKILLFIDDKKVNKKIG